MGPGEDTTGVRDAPARPCAVRPAARRSSASSHRRIGVALGLLIDWFPTPASTQADPIDTLWDVLLIVSVPVFVLVQAVVLYCVWKFRMRPGQEQQDGPPIHGNTRLEVIWTIIPALAHPRPLRLRLRVLDDIEEAPGAAR